MLVLSRKVGESVCVGHNVRVYVVAVRGDKIRLGFDAPKSVPIHRHEVAAAIAKANPPAELFAWWARLFLHPGNCAGVVRAATLADAHQAAFALFGNRCAGEYGSISAVKLGRVGDTTTLARIAYYRRRCVQSTDTEFIEGGTR